MTPDPALPTCFTEHAFMRAQERYGVTLSPDDMRDILAACLAGDAPMLRHNARTNVHVVMHNGVRFVVGVRNCGLIITFLPPNGDRSDLDSRRHSRSAREFAPAGREPTPYKRTKIRMCDLRRGDFPDAGASS